MSSFVLRACPGPACLAQFRSVPTRSGPTRSGPASVQTGFVPRCTAMLSCMALVGLAGTPAAAAPADVDRGAALFAGREQLAPAPDSIGARLPPARSACIACHTAPPVQARGPGARAAARAAEAKQAPLLTAQWLLQPRARRGGPPSRFDQTTFCRAVASGIDPQFIVMRTSMPRYLLTQAQCTALWTYLTAVPGAAP